ncbi:WD40 repeat-containing anti telomeric silencing-like protein [Encephalitozoon intestinalis ATCC 50506]|uniref:WD40 repeat-containing anti telomeric silencing-like protein n=1 Tax=Encephalitozoon intestinalis (strain ATCC 50506) TaxID=876142 RepID=E0S5G6_ENCIT|nr:WD40 repeat-containing anti telomeric silencing-like protein [Encephalitozoon intestinalis ATCC 50506]ADM10951.1 WD40 repeat-containing anti telomeric silencing-like protein [Encephalitozoon intestinalis ATCC 50506]UTX44587.1 WD40 repeat-containing protein [Encephalitozoon intestinalis]
MIEMSRDEINQLVYKYLEDEGYIYTLFTFKNEAAPSDKPLPHSLISLVGKGLQYLYGTKHLQGNSVVACETRFCLSEEHVCGFLKKEPPSSREDHISEEKGTMSVDVEEISLDRMGVGLLSCWNRDSLGIYTAAGEVLGIGSEGLRWKREMKNLTSLSWNDDELVVGNEGGEVITVNVSSGRTRSYACHSKSVTRVRQRGRGILSSGRDGRIVMMNNGITEVNVSECEVEDVVWMGENEVGCSLSDFSVSFVDVSESKVSRIGTHKGQISGMEYNESMLSTSSHDGTFGVWDVGSMEGSKINAHEGGVNDHKWTNDKIVTCGSDRLVKLWDIEKSTPVCRLEHKDKVLAVDCSSYLIASGSLDGEVILSDSRCREVYRYKVDGSVFKLLFSTSGSYLCICISGSSPKLISLKHL